MNPQQTLRHEALRLHQRYQRELIERFSVCPWAKAARVQGRSRAYVATNETCSVDEIAPVLVDWADDESVDVAFVIAPRFTGGPDELAAWASAIAEQRDGVFLTAPFYPSAPGSAGSIQFLRQTPDPTVQLVRRSLLEQIRSQDPPHYRDMFDIDLAKLEAMKPPQSVAASVVAHNERTLEREGRAEIQRVLDDIRGDRQRSYARVMGLF